MVAADEVREPSLSANSISASGSISIGTMSSLVLRCLNCTPHHHSHCHGCLFIQSIIILQLEHHNARYKHRSCGPSHELTASFSGLVCSNIQYIRATNQNLRNARVLSFQDRASACSWQPTACSCVSSSRKQSLEEVAHHQQHRFTNRQRNASRNRELAHFQ
jgi:hypothetical protein